VLSPAATLALVGIALLLVGFAAYERRGGGPRDIGLIAVLIAAAAAGRILFAGIPSAQPVTAIAILAGVALGPRAGAAVGAGAALVSNAFLGQGPWTPWQMLLWGAAGATAGLIAPLLRRSRLTLVGFGVAWSLAFGAVMDVYQLAVFGPAFTVSAFVAVHARALPFDAVHALATAAILGVAGPTLLTLIGRSAVRVRGRWSTSSEEVIG
jgi:energy-coupling factor transport system substrate-specific component